MAKIGINIATGSLQAEEMIVGIDLGTTNSLVAVIHPESRQPLALKEHDNSSLVPSIVHFGKTEVTVGEMAKKYLIAEPENTIFSVKRLMGKSFNDVRSNASFFSYKIIDDDTERLVKVQVADKFYSPIELSSYILKELKARAEHILKTAVKKAVITVPAYFNDSQRQATRDAGKLAGLEVLRIINEPTAASLAYGLGLKKDEEKLIAVYDLGGGTFDVSILRITNGIFEVLSTNGDTYLGGDDFDQAIVNYWLDTEIPGADKYKKDKEFAQFLRLEAEKAKRTLSVEPVFTTRLSGYILQLAKVKFEELIEPFIQKTLASCETALNDAKISKSSVQEIIMVGGSTRVPRVQQAVTEFFGKKLHNELNPDEVVALGAAVQADILAGNNKEFLLIDVTPLSLGIETIGGLMDVLIPRNTKIPTRVARQYTTQKDGQTGIRISVYQGERDLVNDNRKLAEFNFTGIPSMPAGLPKVEVSFFINADGILVIKTKELRSGVEQHLEVKPQYGLTDAEVEQMLLDSITHAQEDIKIRALTEATIEAQQLIETTENFVAKNKQLLTEEEVSKVSSSVNELKVALSTKEKDNIQKKISTLNEASRSFSERIMNMAVQSALKGKEIN